jgi:cobalt-zinc-cadmium efflux system membrane fusion protein
VALKPYRTHLTIRALREALPIALPIAPTNALASERPNAHTSARPNAGALVLVLGMALAIASGCSRQSTRADGHATGEKAAEEPEPLSVTRWTGKTELFAEYPTLVVGQTSRFAIHLTRLDTFKALTAGQVEVQLRGGSGQPETFRVDAPSRPGIFGVDVKPTSAGTRQLVIVLRASGLDDEHQVGGVTVYPNAEAARAAAPAEEAGAPGISFLKEQQWSLDFGTAIVAEQALRESIRVPARIEPRHDGASDVVAPIDGRLVTVANVPLGANVSRGQELARLLPPPAIPGDLPQLRRAQAEAQTALTLATRDRERAERLTAAGAAPAKRLDEARAAEEQAKARLSAAEASLAHYNAARAGGSTDDAGLFVVRAPIGGVVAHRDATTGANVSAGRTLFRVVDTAQVLVVGQVPEGDAVRARAAKTAELEVAGDQHRVPAGRLTGIGKVLEQDSRTLPITFALDNRGPALPVGQTAFLHLLFDSTAPTPAVPAEAIVDDAGRPIVFVQVEGETFERRAVTLGARTGDLVQVTDGVKAGERVVTKGAYLVRLASLSTSVPAHGHVH